VRRSRYPEDRSGNSVDVNQHRSDGDRSNEPRRSYYETSDEPKLLHPSSKDDYRFYDHHSPERRSQERFARYSDRRSSTNFEDRREEFSRKRDFYEEPRSRFHNEKSSGGKISVQIKKTDKKPISASGNFRDRNKNKAGLDETSSQRFSDFSNKP